MIYFKGRTFIDKSFFTDKPTRYTERFFYSVKFEKYVFSIIEYLAGWNLKFDYLI